MPEQKLRLTVGQFATGLGSAAWRMNLAAFCAALDWPEDEYARGKFLDFQQLASLLGQFDNLTLETLLLTPQVKETER